MVSYISQEIAHRWSGDASLSGGRTLQLAYKLQKKGLVTVTLVSRIATGHNRSNTVKYVYSVVPTDKGLEYFVFPEAAV